MFATKDDIRAWATKSFFGSRTHEFSQAGNELFIVNGTPTSGRLSSQIAVFGRTKGESTYRQILITSVIYADIRAKEDAHGALLTVGQQVVLSIPFEIVTFPSVPGRLLELRR
jgi:hypothetical protein